MKWLFVIGLALSPISVSAQDISGSGRAMDGDSLSMAGIAIRLHGVDAPELNQTCAREGQSWACGKESSAKLAQLVRGAHRTRGYGDFYHYHLLAAGRIDVVLEGGGWRWLRLRVDVSGWRRFWPPQCHLWLRRKELPHIWPLIGAALALHRNRVWLGQP